MNLNELFELLWGLLRGVSWAANATLDLGLHAAWALCASLLGFYLTYLTTRGLYFVLASLLHSPTSPPMRVVRGMVGCSWSAALFFSLAAHMWWDRLLVL